jgi:hypothetical protein
MASILRHITQEEWDAGQWIEVTTIGELADGKRVFIPGMKQAPIPEGCASSDGLLPAMTHEPEGVLDGD